MALALYTSVVQVPWVAHVVNEVAMQQVAAPTENEKWENLVAVVVIVMVIDQENLKVGVKMETTKEILFQMHHIQHPHQIPPHPFLFSMQVHDFSAPHILQLMLQPSPCPSQFDQPVQPLELNID